VDQLADDVGELDARSEVPHRVDVQLLGAQNEVGDGQLHGLAGEITDTTAPIVRDLPCGAARQASAYSAATKTRPLSMRTS
jgi:hypothetical protein